MTLLVDTSVWSLAFRRDAPPDDARVRALRDALGGGEAVASTGLILTEVLRGALPPGVRDVIRERFSYLDLVEPTFSDYEQAAAIANACRGHGVQLGTVDAVIAQLAISRELTLLSADRDFEHAARFLPLQLWSAAS